MNTDTVTSPKKKRSPPKVKKPAAFSQDEVDLIVEQARKETAKETEERVRDEIVNEDPMDTDDNGLFSSNEPLEPLNTLAEEPDLFEYIEKNFISRGIGVVYYIQKDGMFQKEMRHPLSWAKLQAQFNGGHYKVTAKHGTTKQYIRSQTMEIADTEGAERPQQNQTPVVIQQPQAPVSPQLDPNQLMELVAKIGEATRRDDKSSEREESKANSNILTTLLTVTQAQSKDTMTMMMEMNKSNSEMMRAMQDNTSKMIEKMDDKFTRLMEASKPKESGPGTFELIKMLNEERKAGMEQMKMVIELSNERAEELAERNTDDAGSSSTIGTLIKGVLPLLSTVNTQMQQQPMMQQQIPVQPARSLPPRAVAQRSTAGQNHNTVQRPAQHATVIRPTSSPTQSPTQKAVSPTTQPARPTSPTRPQVVEAVAPQKSIEQLFEQATELQKKFVETTLPLIAQPMQMGVPSEQAARNVFKTLTDWKSKDLTPEALLKEFPFDLSWQIAVSFGLGSPAHHQWLKEFYAHLKTTVDASTALPEPTVRESVIVEHPSKAVEHRGGQTGQPTNG